MIRAKLIEARDKRGWTQEQLAERVDVDVATIRRWEHGDASPQGRNKWKLLNILEASSEDDLDLGRKMIVENPASTLHSLVRHSYVARLIMLVFSGSEGALVQAITSTFRV
jgi:transcriptional regulator with XRE-family HTH domain